MRNDPASIETLNPRAAIAGSEINAALLECDPDALYFSDRAGLCRKVNSRCAEVLGAACEEMTGHPMACFFPEEAGGAVQRQEAAVLADGEARECEVVLAEDRPFRILHCAVRNGRGEWMGVAGRMRDLSEIRRLQEEVVEASEREMRRIACDLHDELCQELAAVSLISKLLERRLAEGDEAQAKVAAHVADMTRHMAAKTRAIVYNLAPEPMAGEAFVTGLRRIAEDLCCAYGVKCGIEGGWPEGLRDEAVAVQLFRIAHEAMHNAARHSGGGCITVRLRVCGGVFALSVSDNGKGFPPEEPASTGLGLSSMRYRAGLAGGELAVQSIPGAGTSIVCKVPLA